MNREQWIEANQSAAARVPRLGIPLLILLLLGFVGFYLATADGGIRAWQAYWINFLFWAGLTQAGVVLAAIYHIVKGRWGGSLIRIGLLQVAFVPVTLLLYIGIVFAAGDLLPWVSAGAPGKEWWLDLNFMLIRDGAGLVILAIASVVFAYFTVRPDAGAMSESGVNPFPAWLTRGWRGLEAERERSTKMLNRIAPVLVVLYAVVYSLLGFDMVMSLDFHWFSSLFGIYFFITNLYFGMAFLIIITTLLRKPLGLESTSGPGTFHDIGKLMSGFCLLSFYMFWSQFLVIWYGDLPEETTFLVLRMHHSPWQVLFYIVLFMGFIVPFLALLNRKIKTIPGILSFVALIILIGGFSERLWMILPSLNTGEGAQIMFGLPEILITLGFLGLYGMVLLWSIRRAPLVPAEAPPSGQ